MKTLFSAAACTGEFPDSNPGKGEYVAQKVLTSFEDSINTGNIGKSLMLFINSNKLFPIFPA